MRLKRRLADALRSPERLAAFVRRVGEATWHGELPALFRRMRPRGPTLAEYRDWIAASQRAAPAPTASRFIVALDPADDVERAALVAAFTPAPPGALGVLVRNDAGRWGLSDGDFTAAPQAFALAHGVTWIWWVAEPLALLPDAVTAVTAGCAAPAARIVYADHDTAGDDGRPTSFELKPAWDRVQVLEQPYAGPLLAVHVGIAAFLDDARDRGPIGQWRLLLDAVESLPDEAIVHVPQVVARLPAAARPDRVHEREGVASRIRSIVEARDDRVVAEPTRTPWLRFVVPAECTVSIVVPTRDRHPLIERCLRSVLASEFPRDAELVVVDNGSTDPRIAELLRSVATRVRLKVVPLDVPFNFPLLCNAGVDAASGRIVVLLNNDCVVASRWLIELVGVAARDGVGAVGPLLLYPDGLLQSAGILLGVNRTATSALAGFRADDAAAIRWCRSRRRVSAVLGACIAVARDRFRRVGGMDERFGVSHNELDLCLRLESEGFANVFTPFARVVHEEGGTRGFEVTAAERERLQAEEALFFARWGRLLDDVDPAHHPALARSGNPFALVQAPESPRPRAGWRRPPAPHGD